MMTEDVSAVLARIQARLDALGLSERGAAEKAGLSAAAIRNIREGKSVSPRLDTFQKLAPVLNVTPEWLAFGVGEDIERAKQETASRAGDLMAVLGEVAAGRWLEVEQDADAPRYDPAPITPDPRWRREAQYGLIVRGSSLNRYAIDGDTLHCLDIAQSGRMPVSGELVIVEQVRDGGFLRERTAKAYHEMEDDTVELRAFSDDPRWDAPIYIPHRVYSHVLDKGLTIEIKAVVLGAYRPTPRVPRR